MRTDDDDRDYYNRRAEAEIEAASATENAAACRAHYQMAELYLERAYSDESDTENGATGEHVAAS